MQNRIMYDRIRKAYERLGKGKVRLTQSDLVLTQALDATTKSYNFDVLTNEGTVAQEENRLNITDEFVVLEIGLFLFARYGVAPIDTTKPYALLTAPITNIAAAQAGYGPLWNGNLKFEVNNVVWLEKWNTQRHYVQPRQQADTQVAGTVAAHVPNSNLRHEGFYPNTPSITLSGAKKNDISLSLNNPMAAAGTIAVTDQSATTLTYSVSKIALVLRGFLAQNAAKFQG